MKNILKKSLLVVLVAGCFLNAKAYNHVGLATGTVELGTISKAPGAGSKFGKYTDGAYLYRGSAYSFSSGKGIKTQNSNSGVVFYLANSADVTVTVMFDASKNFANVDAQLSTISDSDYDKFFMGTENNTAVTFSKTDYQSKTVVIDQKGNFQETFSAVPAGYYYIVCTGTGSNTYFTQLIVGGSTPVTPTVSSITVSPTSATLDINDTQQLTATVSVTPSTADNTVTWSTSDANVATVSSTGLVTAVGQGTATITATSNLDNTKSATCAITVNAPAAPIPVTAISLPATATVGIGATTTLTVSYTPTDANTGKAITWTSDNPNIATVDNTGKVTGVAAGTATITATSEKGKTATCTVTVKAVAVTGVSISPATATVKIGSTIALTADVTPTDATNKDVTWSSSDDNIATVINGKVTGIAEGTVTITATSVENNTKHGECLVSVQTGSPLPDVGLKTHTPEIYEDPAGYNTPLAKFKDREYEVYYTAKGKIGGSGSGVPLVYVNESGNEISTATKAKDGWFEYQINSGDSEDKALTKDEFTVKRGTWKTTTDNYLVMQVKGYDQFRFFAAEKKDNDPTQELHVFIDDMEKEMPMTHSTSATVRTFDITPDEHVIKIKATGSSNQYIYGWSLRVTDNPIVRYLSGPKTQTVYQTKPIEPVIFRVRRAESYRLTWVGGKEIPGLALNATTNDSVFLQGTADAAVGSYIYKVEALDASGNVASFEQGTVTIQTQVFDVKNSNDFSTNIAEPIKPMNFLFYASNSSDITLSCDIEGLTLTYEKDSIAVLSGTPALGTAEGEHTYSISAAGGNTITGKINIVVPDPYFEPIAEAKVRDGSSITFVIIVRHAQNVTVTGLPGGFTSNYNSATDTLTISGTANVGAPYPKSIEFTMTAAPRYEGKEQKTEKGKLIVIDPDAKAVLVVCKGIKNANDDPYCKYLGGQGFDITLREQDVLAGSSYEAFDLLLISETVDANNEEVLKLVRGEVSLPVLNMKGFTYSPGRVSPAGWGEPDNGAVDTLDTKNIGCNIILQRAEHEIFQQLTYPVNGKTVKILDTYTKRGVMPIAVNKQGALCLATAATRGVDYYSEGPLQTAIHEIPASERNGHKYICLPLSADATLSTQGKKLIDGIVEYLLSSTPTTVALPVLRIDRFAVEGFEGKIDQTNNTIELVLEEADYKALDSLTSVAPEITIADDSLTHVLPATDTLSMAHCTFIPMVFTVTDYINVRAYSVSVRVIRAQGLEDVEAYTAGEWINIYDIYGRKVATTNEDIYTMALPRGVYIIQTSKGNTLKIMK